MHLAETRRKEKSFLTSMLSCKWGKKTDDFFPIKVIFVIKWSKYSQMGLAGIHLFSVKLALEKSFHPP